MHRSEVAKLVWITLAFAVFVLGVATFYVMIGDSVESIKAMESANERGLMYIAMSILAHGFLTRRVPK